MNRKNMGASTSVLLSLMDIFVLVAAVGLDLMVFGMHFLEEARYRWLLIILFLVFAEIFIISSRAGYLYNVTMFLYTDRMIKKNTLAFLLSACPVGMLLLYTCPLREAIDFYLTFLLFDYCLLVIKVWLTKPIVNLHHRQYTFRTAFLGKRERYDLFRRYLSKTSIPYTDVGYIARNRREYEAAKNDYIGCAEDLEDLIRNYHIDQIFVGQDNDASLAEAQQYLDLCMNMGVTVRFIIDFYKRGFAKSYVSSVSSGKYEVFSKQIYNISQQWDITAGGYVPDDGLDQITPCPIWYNGYETFGDEETKKEFPIQLIGHHTKTRTHSSYGNVDWLKSVAPQQIWISTYDAANLGIENGDEVRVSTRRGVCQLTAKVTDRMMPGVASLPQGSWYKPQDWAAVNPGDTSVVDYGGCISTLTSQRPTCISKGNGVHTNLCKIEKA